MRRQFPFLSLLTGTLLFTSCGAPSPTNPPQAARGQLDLTVAGLPQAPSSQPVTVTGPNYRKTLSSSALLDGLAPATYAVTASNVVLNGTTYYPQVEGSPVDVKANTTLTASVTYNAVNVRITPDRAVVEPGALQVLSAWTQGTSNTRLSWTASGGTLSATGGPTVTWAAPHQAGTYTVTAASAFEPGRIATATLTVLPNELQWQTQFGAEYSEYTAGVALDQFGNAYMPLGTAGGFYNGVALVKFDARGKQLWKTDFGPSLSDTDVRGVTTLPDGTTYVVGATRGTFDTQKTVGYYDAYLAKFTSAGALAWVRQFGSADFDNATGVSADALGNVFVVGSRSDTSGSGRVPGLTDGFIAAFDQHGTLRWQQAVSSAEVDWATGVAADGHGGAYLVGSTTGQLGEQANAGQEDVFLAHYGAGGQRGWLRQFGTAPPDRAAGVAVDTDGSVYVGGFLWPATAAANGVRPARLVSYTESGPLFVGKFTASGDRVWLKFPPAAANQQTTLVNPSGVAARDGIVYIAGTLDSSGFVYDALLTRLDTGSDAWTSRKVATSETDAGSGVALASDGNVRFAGRTEGALPDNTARGVSDGFLVNFGP